MSRYEKIELTKFDEMVNDHHNSLFDVKTPLAEAVYSAGGHLKATEQGVLGIAQIEGKMNDVAYNEMCTRIGAPASWMRSPRCPDDLEVTIVNRLKQDDTNPALLRYRYISEEAICRAVLSEQYLAYNHLDMWNDVKNAVVGTRLQSLEPVIWKPYISDSMDAWVLFEGVNADPDPDGEPRIYDGGGAGGLKPAIHIRNSEDGTGRVRIESGLYRSYCTNGVIFGFKSDANLEAIHRGGSKHFMRTRVAIAVAEAARMCQLGIKKFLEATQIEIKTDVMDDIVNEWGKNWKISIKVSEDWARAIAGSRTWGDIVMSTSDFAGGRTNRDETVALEELAGNMLITGARRDFRA